MDLTIILTHNFLLQLRRFHNEAVSINFNIILSLNWVKNFTLLFITQNIAIFNSHNPIHKENTFSVSDLHQPQIVCTSMSIYSYNTRTLFIFSWGWFVITSCHQNISLNVSCFIVRTSLANVKYKSGKFVHGQLFLLLKM